MSNIKDYELVFFSSNNIFSVIVVFILVIIVVLYLLNQIRTLKINFIILAFVKFVLYIFLIGSILQFIISIYEIYKVKNAIENKRFSIAKGIIKKFHPMNKFGHEYESFIVDNILFEISYTGNTPDKKTLFYTMTKNMGGPIKKDNQQVIIYYIRLFNNNRIIKLYIKN